MAIKLSPEDIALVGPGGEISQLARALAHAPDSDDLLQEGVVAALSQTRAPRRLRTWLKQVLRNRRIDELRRARRWHVDNDAPDSLAGDQPAADESVHQDELLRAMREAFRRLDPGLQNLLWRRFVRDERSSDIARELALSPATVRWRVHEALRQLRVGMDERFGGREQWMRALLLVPGLGEAPAQQPQGDRLANPPQGWSSMGKTTKTVLLFSSVLTVAAVIWSSNPRILRQASVPGISPASGLGVGERDAMTVSPRPTTRGRTSRGDSIAAAPHNRAGRVSRRMPRERNAVGALSMAERQVCQDKFRAIADGKFINFGADWVLDTSGKPVVANLELSTGCIQSSPFSNTRQQLCEPGESPTYHEGFARCVQYYLLPDFTPEAEELPPPESEPAHVQFSLFVNERCVGDVCVDDPLVEHIAEPEGNRSFAQLETEAMLNAVVLPTIGSSEAELNVIACGDYGLAVRKTLPRLQRLVDRHPPLSVKWMHNTQVRRPRSILRAWAAEAAGRQGRFWQYHAELRHHSRPETREGLVEVAHELGLDVERFLDDLDNPVVAQAVADQTLWCRMHGNNSSPVVLVDGLAFLLVRGDRSLYEAIEGLLAKRR